MNLFRIRCDSFKLFLVDVVVEHWTGYLHEAEISIVHQLNHRPINIIIIIIITPAVCAIIFNCGQSIVIIMKREQKQLTAFAAIRLLFVYHQPEINKKIT